MDDMSKKYTKHIKDLRRVRINAAFSCRMVHASILRKLGSNRTCGHYYALTAMHLVQKVNVGTA